MLAYKYFFIIMALTDIDININESGTTESEIPTAGVRFGDDSSRSSIIFQQRHEYKHSNLYSSPLTAITRTSLTTTSSSSCSCSHSITSGGSNDVGNGSNIYPDEIFVRRKRAISSQKQKEVGNTKSAPRIPFLDYLEKKVRELNEEHNSASASICVGTRSPQRNRNIITHPDPELSPISSQSAAAAEADTIRRLRREVFGLYLTMDALKKNSQEWMLLKSKLDVASEELNAVLEDQNVVRSIQRSKWTTSAVVTTQQD